jgi:hypothetical protein
MAERFTGGGKVGAEAEGAHLAQSHLISEDREAGAAHKVMHTPGFGFT